MSSLLLLGFLLLFSGKKICIIIKVNQQHTAYETLKKVDEVDATIVILKEYSPSCGSMMIYNGEFNDEKVLGNGVTAALLKRKGIKIASEEYLINFHEEI